MNLTRLSVFALPLVALSLPIACSKKPPQNPVVTPADAAPEAAPDWDAAPVAMLPEAGAAVVAPEAGADAGVIASPDMTGGEPAIVAALDKLGKSATVANMAQEGEQGRAQLKEGEHFAMLITLQPNRCYTIVGTSPAGSVSKLEMRLLAPPFFNVPAGQSGAKDGANPVIGRGKQHLCPILPVPIAYKLDVVAVKGAGPIGVRVYAKNK